MTASRRETALTESLIKHLRGLPETHARKVHGSVYQDKGEPDIDACSRGRAVKVEVKDPDGGEPTPLQYKRLRAWEAAGALAGWVTSLEELQELLTHLEDRTWRNPRIKPDPNAAKRPAKVVVRTPYEHVRDAVSRRPGLVADTLAGLIAHLGSRREWSMEDNFSTTEAIAGLAGDLGLPSAGDQSDEAVRFYEEAGRGA